MLSDSISVALFIFFLIAFSSNSQNSELASLQWNTGWKFARWRNSVPLVIGMMNESHVIFRACVPAIHASPQNKQTCSVLSLKDHNCPWSYFWLLWLTSDLPAAGAAVFLEHQQHKNYYIFLILSPRSLTIMIWKILKPHKTTTIPQLPSHWHNSLADVDFQ